MLNFNRQRGLFNSVPGCVPSGGKVVSELLQVSEQSVTAAGCAGSEFSGILRRQSQGSWTSGLALIDMAEADKIEIQA
jgi:hypothetical protein